jgi:hypothetical protein
MKNTLFLCAILSAAALYANNGTPLIIDAELPAGMRAAYDGLEVVFFNA